MAKRSVGRPRKVGIWDYWLKVGNPRDMRIHRYDTDTEIKRAAQKHVNSLKETTKRYDVAAYGRLVDIHQRLNEINETDSFGSPDPLVYEWSCHWGDSGKLELRIEIWRTYRNA